MQLRKYSDLRKSQHKIVEMIMAETGAMIGADMGIGKTGAALTAFRQMLDWCIVKHILVVAPLLVAEETWPTELETWEHTEMLTYEVLTGEPARREQRARRLPEITIVNKENLVWLIELWGDEWPYDHVCIDEISSMKNPTKRNNPTQKMLQDATTEILARLPAHLSDEEREAKLAKGLKKVRGNLTRFGAFCGVLHHIHTISGLTGTLSPNGMGDVWGPYYLLDQGERLGSNITVFRTRYFEKDYMGYKYTLREGAFELIVKKISDITVSMRTEDFVDMPPIVDNTIYVTLPPKVMKAYKEFERKMVLAEHDIKAVNAGVLTGKLLQLANGSVYDDEKTAIEIHDLKLQALDLVIEEAAGEPVLVAYSYQFDLVKLKKRYPHAEVIGEGKDIVKRWNAGKIQLLLAHPQSAGHGLNLQFGGCIMVWYGLCWSLEYYLQMRKRLHRPGQTRPVFMHHLVAKGTMDERVMAVLPEKNAVQDHLIEATLWRPQYDPLL